MNVELTLPEWEQKFESGYLNRGYKRYNNQRYKNEDFAYWKTFYEGEGKTYQIGILVYNFTKYRHDAGIGASFECLLLETDNRIDLSVSDKNLDINKFERMAAIFYETMKEFRVKDI